jgi:hypothetical protein
MDTLINLPHLNRRRDRVFSIRLTLNEYQAVKRLAEHLTTSPSALARYILVESIHHLTVRNNGGPER